MINLWVVALSLAAALSAVASSAEASAFFTQPPDAYTPPFPLVYPIDAPRQFADTFGTARDGGDRLHQGGDLFAPKMSPVLATAQGWVSAIDWSPNAGFYIDITHAGGWRSRYLHLNNDTPGTDDGLGYGLAEGIAVGTSVAAGQMIGYVGDSGNAEGSSPHLHFEIRMPDWTPVNPYPFVIGRSSETTLYVLPEIAPDPLVSGLEVVGHIENDAGFNGDVWAYDGVAYLGTIAQGETCPATGVRLYSVAEPSAPVALGVISDGHEGSSTEQVWAGPFDTLAFSGNLAVVAHRVCDGSAPGAFRGFTTYDVSDAANPIALGAYETGPGTAGVAGFDVWVEPDRVLVVAAVPNSLLDHMRSLGDVRIVDITDPANPQDVADWDFRRDAEPAERDAAANGADPRDLFSNGVTIDPAGRRAFVSQWDAGVTVLDLSTPEQPRALGRIGSIGYREGMSSSTSFGGEVQLLIVNHEDLDPLDDHEAADEPHGDVPGDPGDQRVDDLVAEAISQAADESGAGETQSWGRQVVFDVAGEGDPALVAAYSVDEALPDADGLAPLDGIYSVADSLIDGNYAYSAWLAGGLRVVDLTAPEGLTEVASFLPPPAIDPFGHFVSPNGVIKLPLAWSVHVDEGLVYVSDVNTGLWVLRLTDPSEPAS